MSNKPICDAREAKDRKKWLAAEKRPWDGRAMIYSEVTERFYGSPGEALNDFDEGTPDEQMRLVICEHIPSPEQLAEDLREAGYVASFDDIDDDWLRAHSPLAWTPGKYALGPSYDVMCPACGATLELIAHTRRLGGAR